MTKKEKALILQAKQDLDLAVAHIVSGKITDAELLVVNVRDELGKLLGEVPEIES